MSTLTNKTEADTNRSVTSIDLHLEELQRQGWNNSQMSEISASQNVRLVKLIKHQKTSRC